MKVELRSDHVHISGYVNAVDRLSRPLTGSDGRRFVERIMPGAFRRSLEQWPKVDVMSNHQRTLTDTGAPGVTLEEDSIGLRCEADLFDAELVERAKNKELVGWSFGFWAERTEEKETDAPGADYERDVLALRLKEVSIIDKRMTPAYTATSIEARSTDERLPELRAEETEIEYSDAHDAPPEPADLRGVKRRELELKRKG